MWWDENTCGLVGKWEQREGEPGSNSTHSMAGAMLACLRVARAGEQKGNHRPVTHSESWGVLGEGSGQCNSSAALEAEREKVEKTNLMLCSISSTKYVL